MGKKGQHSNGGAKGLNSSVNAAPFVPSTTKPASSDQNSPAPSKSKASSTALTPAAVKAAPFVPSVTKSTPPSSSANGSNSHGGAATRMSVDAPSFVPTQAAGPAGRASDRQGKPSSSQYDTPSSSRGLEASPGPSSVMHAGSSAMIGRSPAKGGRGATLYPGRSARGRGGRGMPGGRRQAGALVTNPGPMAQYNVAPGKAQLTARFMAEGLRQQLQHHSYLVQAQWPGQAAGGPALPDHVQHFHTLYPLEDMLGADERISPALGIKSLVVKAINAHDGLAYALRRVDGKQVIPTGELVARARHLVDVWSPVSYHPNLVALRGAFVSSELDGHDALIFVHDYHPGAMTLEQAHLQPTSTASGLVRNAASEEQLWSYLVQLTAALRAVHQAGLVLHAGCLTPSKVLVNSLGKVRVACCGIIDTLVQDSPSPEDLAQLQRRDLMTLGQLILALACGSSGLAMPSLEYASQQFSMELIRLLAALLAAVDGGSLSNVRQLAGALGERMLVELDSRSMINDSMMSELSKEVENGRLLRLLVKLGFINERPGGDVDKSWSETGDRYVLKLFRDHVFHQVSEEGGPLLEWGHVVECLGKLDAGVPEKLLMMSRDEKSMLVASYADIKKCVEAAYNELRTASMAARASRYKV